MEIGAFIFDVDGVLTDTVELHYRSWVQLAREEHIPFTRARNEQMRGLSRPASLIIFLAGREVSEDQAHDFLERKNKYFLAELAALGPSDLLPGVLPLLCELRAASIKVGIGSASKNAQEVVRRLGIAPFIDAYSDGHLVERSKPAPDVFLAAAGLLGAAPGTCVVVEDAEAGIEAARAAGMRVVGVGPAERIAAADLCVGSLVEITLDRILAAFNAQPAYGKNRVL